MLEQSPGKDNQTQNLIMKKAKQGGGHIGRLNCPLMVRKQIDWQTALELTSYLRKFDQHDPVKYDFALFGLGVVEKF